MKINKTYKISMFTLTIAILTIMLCAPILLPTASSHIPPINIPTYAFCAISPNPIGVGQYVNVNFWINQPPPTASAAAGDRWQNMTVIVTKPDRTTQTLGPFTSDATGGSHTSYTPTTVGNYSFQMFFGGQTLAGENGANPTNAYIGDYFEPSSSNVFQLTVQQNPIPYSSQTPLPTEFWTRPIYAENNNWYSIGGSWLGLGISTFASSGMYDASGNYNPYTTAPNSAHILWTKPVAFGGTIGGSYGNGSEQSNYYSTSQYEPKFAPIIMNGILYYTNYPGAGTNPAGWTAVNLKTGEVIWTKNTTEILRCGQILYYDTPNQYGALAYLWSIPYSPFSLIGPYGTLSMWDAMTGNYILQVTGVPATPIYTAMTQDSNGNLIIYYVDQTSNTLNMWNSTRCINLGGTPFTIFSPFPDANSWAWRPGQDASVNFSYGIQWTKPLATNISGVPIDGSLSIKATSGDTLLLVAGLGTNAGSSVAGYETGYQIEAGYSAIDGSQLWIENRTYAPYSLLNADPQPWVGTGSGVYVMAVLSTQTVYGFSLTTGKQVWTQTLPNASPFSSLGVNAVVANGTIYLYCYGGDVYAYDLQSGHLNWQYHTPSGGYESPYGQESLWTFTVGTVADGKLYLPEGHMYSPPLFHKAQQLCLNTTDGSVIWSIDAFDTTSAPAIADGVMTTLNAYDNQIYAYGMGPTKTTVNAPNVGVSTDTPITITGTVTDISAGASQEAVAANFPNGLPCVSDASMSGFMEAVYMQQSMPTNITGVPVILSVLDSNGNYRAIGTTTTTASGFYSFNWKPDIAGNYTVTATFAGTKSYYGSSAQTAFYASASAPTAAPTATPLTGLASNTTLMYAVVAMIIVFIVGIAIVTLLVTRKRP